MDANHRGERLVEKMKEQKVDGCFLACDFRWLSEEIGT
jgi:hypothetical protein